jgi:protein-S-isoprenylcysteine O-methyltransferase Ste14
MRRGAGPFRPLRFKETTVETQTATPAARRPLLPPAYFLMAIIAMIALHLALPLASWIQWPWTLTGAVPVAIGLVLAFAGSRHFKRVGTTLYPFETSSQLVTGGVFVYLALTLRSHDEPAAQVAA